MASMRERKRADGSIAYQVLFRHNGRQRSETFNSVRAQKRFANNCERLGVEAALEILNAADDSDIDMPILGDWLAHHIDSLSGVTQGTIKRYRSIAANIADRKIGQLPIDEIEERHVVAWVREREKEGRKGKTIRNEHAVISAALARAVKDDKIRINVAKGVKIADSVREEMTILLPGEFQVLTSRIPDTMTVERALVRFLYGTGARFSEATAIRVSDHRKAETPPTVSIVRSWKRTGGKPELGVPKTRMGRRTISLGREVHEDLLALAKGKRPGDLMFSYDGEPVTHQRFWELWQAWTDDSLHEGKPSLGKRPRIHDLRHSHASWMIGRGMNMLDLQHRLGHESIETTAGTYGHMMPEALVQAARHADAMFEVSQSEAVEAGSLPQIEA